MAPPTPHLVSDSSATGTSGQRVGSGGARPRNDSQIYLATGILHRDYPTMRHNYRIIQHCYFEFCVNALIDCKFVAFQITF